MVSSIIEVLDLVRRYGEVTAVDGISFSVAEGDFFGFLGPNGAGKTTTMRILATLLKKTSGAVRVAGFDVEREPDGVRRAIGFAMQDVSLDSLASGYENLQLLGVLYGLTPRQARARAEELVEMVGLGKVADRWVNSYSGGMRRRLDLAGTLMHHPRLLFLDEPTQGLDPQARRTIWDYLRRLNAEGTTVFLTTHHMEEADILCRNLAFIEHGKIVQQGTPVELKAEMGGDLITLQFQPGVAMAPVERALASALGQDTSVQVLGRSDVPVPGEPLQNHEHDPHAQRVMPDADSIVRSPLSADGRQITLCAHHAAALAPRLIRELDAIQVAPLSLSISQPSLEDVFVKLVGRSIMDDDSQLVKGRDPFVEGRR